MADLSFVRRYYSGEEAQVGDVIALGGNPTAVEWTVTEVWTMADGATALVSLRRERQTRTWEYASRYRLIRRGLKPKESH